MRNNAHDHINKIRREKYWLDENGHLIGRNPLASDLQNSIDHLSEGLYSRNAHFIFELIQNAEDNSYNGADPSLSFALVRTDPTETPGSHGAIIIRNNEVGFTPENVEAICAVGKSTKRKSYGYIGEKGIGFKSVFRVTSNPYIISNGYSFCLPEHDEVTVLGYIVPRWIDKAVGDSTTGTTIILPLDKPEFTYETIEKMLQDIEPETILFLSKIKELKIHTDTGDTFTILKNDSRKPGVQILVEGTRHGTRISNMDDFLLLTECFDKPGDIVHEKRTGITDREVSVAFPLNKENMSAGKVFAYLPVLSDSGFPFLLNADFILTSSREDIHHDVPWNHWLAECSALLVADSLPLLKEKGALTLPLIESFARGFNKITDHHLFHPIAVAVRNAFTNKDLLPADDGTFISARNAKLDRSADLRNLLKQNQLRSLLQSMNTIKWLTGEIPQDPKSDLRRYLIEQLEIEEVRPEKFVELLTDDFLENQDGRWIIDFYSFFNDRTEFWKKPDAALRKRKIIRLEDNTHVIPFKSDGTPNAYLPSSSTTNFPTIKRSIVEDETATEFLKRLGIMEPDSFAEIIEFILPKYAEDNITVPYEENIDDLNKVKKILDEPSHGSSASSPAKLKILLGKLGLAEYEDSLATAEPVKLIPNLLKIVFPSIRFLRAYNGLETGYKSPKEIYNNTSELHLYFQDFSEAWFVCDDYPEELLSLFKELGINDRPKVIKRRPDNNGFVNIDSSHSRPKHWRGLNGFDPDIKVDGIETALSNPSIEKSAFIWNNIALPHSACIHGTVEKSSRQTYENSSNDDGPSELGRLLIKKAWLPNNNRDGFCEPPQLLLSDLTEGFEKDSAGAKELAEKLGMLKPERMQAAEMLAKGNPRLKKLLDQLVNADDDLLDKFENLLPKESEIIHVPPFREVILGLDRPHNTADSINPEPDNSPVSHPETYQRKLNEKVEEGVQRHYSTPRLISPKIIKESPSNKEVRDFLYEEYNGKCQITGHTFQKTNGKNYFVAVSLASYQYAEYLNNPGNMVCLCAEMAARFMYSGFEWLDNPEQKIAEFKAEKDGGTESHRKIRIKLCGEEQVITYSERHFMRLKALFEKA